MSATTNIAFLPNLTAAIARITARAKAENEAEARAIAIRKAKRAIDRPRGFTDAQLREICAAFMALSPTRDELADGWGVYYQRADQHIFAINKREQIARNKAKCQAALAALDDAPLRVAMRHWPAMRAVGAGLMLAGVVAVAFHFALRA